MNSLKSYKTKASQTNKLALPKEKTLYLYLLNLQSKHPKKSIPIKALKNTRSPNVKLVLIR